MSERAVIIDRAIMKEFLRTELEYWGIKRPAGVQEDALVEVFCEYVESDCFG